MKPSYILPVLVVILLLVAPASGSTKKISPGATAFIGETDLDISSALNGCREIGLWPDGADINTDSPKKDITIMPINTADPVIYHYNFTPGTFTGYAGSWYCNDKKPYYPVFRLEEPMIRVKIWDLDHDTDVTGTTIPFLTNVTYRIETNLYPALSYASRPGLNPTDSFYTVSMIDPKGRPASLLYDGNAGNPKTVILPFDIHPFLQASPYDGKNMKDWDHAARSARGEQLYPEGTYPVTARADLNGMQAAYRESGIDVTGKLIATGSVTLTGKPLEIGTPTVPPVGTDTIPEVTNLPSGPVKTATPLTTSVPVAKRTTYAPVPPWLPIIGLAAAGLLAIKRP